MTIIIFLIVLSVLVFVHEMGHFLAAKRAGVEVEEFGFGYPPRALMLGRKWGTNFSLNWIPFGGFVKIFGENYEEGEEQQSVSSEDASHSRLSSRIASSTESPIAPKGKRFTQVSRKWQAAILAAGVTFNIIFAWILFSVGFMIGVPTPADNNFGPVENPAVTIVEVLPDSPAEKAGLKTGDRIENIFTESGDNIGVTSPEIVSDFINKSEGEFEIEVDRGGETLSFRIEPQEGIVEGKKVIGTSMDMIGTLRLNPWQAIVQGGQVTAKLSYLTVYGILDLIRDAVLGKADTSQLTGPVGIVGLVGDASQLGFSYLLTFTALISINLAIINLIPFPALDGGRLLFVGIEGLTKKKINPKFAQITNTVGFALLLLLMIFITIRDVARLF
jgi:regulator of sigma E protease